MNNSENRPPESRVHRAIAAACDRRLGVLDHSFLCQSVGVLNPPKPHCILADETVQNVIALFQQQSIGSILIVHKDQTLAGIFTERDCVRRVLPDFETNRHQSIENFMTKDPIAQLPDITVAFALNLMAEGGFRHLPLVDSSNIPVGIISTRDMMDFIVRTFLEELMKFDTSGAESLL